MLVTLRYYIPSNHSLFHRSSCPPVSMSRFRAIKLLSKLEIMAKLLDSVEPLRATRVKFYKLSTFLMSHSTNAKLPATILKTKSSLHLINFVPDIEMVSVFNLNSNSKTFSIFTTKYKFYLKKVQFELKISSSMNSQTKPQFQIFEVSYSSLPYPPFSIIVFRFFFSLNLSKSHFLQSAE